MKRNIIIMMALLGLAIVLTGCATNRISDIKNEEHFNKTVAVRGNVTAVSNSGISGYTIKDYNGDIIVIQSKTIPDREKIVTVRGLLLKDSSVGYYIKADY